MTKIIDLTSYTNPDAATDVIPIVDIANNQTKKITRNSLLGITGNPVGHTDSQTISNKTINNTNTIRVQDVNFFIQDDGDNTKQLKFQLSGLTTGTTRTLTIPDRDDTIVTLGGAQTLTSKTLTSPTINTPTIVNPTLQTDTVSEYTSANGVTIDGLNIKDNKLNTNNSVVTANITDAAITSPKLKPTEALVTANGDLSLTSSYQDVVGATVTFSPSTASICVVYIFATLLANSTAVNCALLVDGSIQGSSTYVQNAGADNAIFTASRVYRFTLTATSHTIKLQAKRGGGGSGNAYGAGGETGFYYTLLSQ